MNQSFYQNVQNLMSQQVSFVIVTITAMNGSAPQETGAKMLVTVDSKESPYQGTVGGGKLELFAIEHAQKMITADSKNHTDIMTLNLQSDIGMTCGGVVQLLFEAHTFNAWHIAVFGAGHVAQALIPVLLTLDCQIHCVDSREDWLNKLPVHDSLHAIKCEDFDQVLTPIPKDSFVVAVTQGHGEDVKIIHQIVSQWHPPYIGVIGSGSKAAILKKELSELGINKSLIDKINCPIGFAIGKDIPAEIAISVCAQLLQARDEIRSSI